MSSKFKSRLAAFGAMLAFLSVSGVAMANMPGTVLGQTGNVGISNSGNRTDVSITSGAANAVGQVDWKDFNVKSNEHVNFGFSNVSQTIINRVLGGNESQILGKLTNSCVSGNDCSSYAATSKVLLINPAGVMFGNGSMVDLNSFTVSTFDFNGAKNLNGMTQAQLDAYQTGVLNKMQPVTNDPNVPGREYGSITLDSNYTAAFDDAKRFNNGNSIYNKGNTQIKLDGTTMAHFNQDGSIADVNPNKSINIVSDNISYKDSILRTGENFNYVTGDQAKSLSNVRLITADGVTFQYLANGYSDYYAAQDINSNIQRNIQMDNSGLAQGVDAIKTGDLHIVNTSANQNSNVNISNSVLKANKLISGTNGDIFISSKNDISLDNTRLQTLNTVDNASGQNTYSQAGGEVYLYAGRDIDVNDSLIMTAGAKASAPGNNVAAARLTAGRDVNVQNSKILSNGDARINAKAGKATIDNSLVQAKNLIDESKVQNVTIKGAAGVDINNTVADATGDIAIQSAAGGGVTGDINITSSYGASETNKENKTILAAGGKLSIQGANTKIKDSTLAYSENSQNPEQSLVFHDDDVVGTNNVTISGNTTFAPTKITNGTKGIAPDVSLETNGDFTLDEGATMQRGSYNLTITDSGANTVDGISFTTSIARANANNLSVKSSEGNVIAKNANVKTTKDINLISSKGNVTVENTTLNAGQDANLTAQNNVIIQKDGSIKANRDINVLAKTGDVTINADNITLDAQNNANIEATKGALHIGGNGSLNITAGNDANLTSDNTIAFGNTSSSNIKNNAKIKAGKNITIKSTAGDINAEKTTMGELEYGQKLTFNAKGSNNFTSEDSLKSVNVDYIAGTANNFTTKGDIQFVDSTLNAAKNNITTTQQGGDVILNNLKIEQATTNAADTVTTINAKGNVTTKDVTKSVNSDRASSTHKFPQSVQVDANGSEASSVLDVNKTKLIVKTKVEKDSANPDYGSIILDVKNANNKDAGLELTAENTVYDNNIEAHEGPEVHLNAVDNELSVSRIVTDKLFLDKNDKMIAAPVELSASEKAGLPSGTPSKGYIEVRDKGGFNLDDSDSYDNNPDGFDYTGNYVSQTVKQDVDKDVDVDVKTDVENWEDADNSYEKTTTTTTTTTTTKTTTTTNDKKHTINFENSDEGEFILVYDKTKTEVDTKVDVKTDVKEDLKTTPKPGEPEVVDPDSYINQVRLPREQVEISKTSRISDNTVDQTSNIMSAAAKVELADENGETDNKDEIEE